MTLTLSLWTLHIDGVGWNLKVHSAMPEHLLDKKRYDAVLKLKHCFRYISMAFILTMHLAISIHLLHNRVRNEIKVEDMGHSQTKNKQTSEHTS